MQLEIEGTRLTEVSYVRIQRNLNEVDTLTSSIVADGPQAELHRALGAPVRVMHRGDELFRGRLHRVSAGERAAHIVAMAEPQQLAASQRTRSFVTPNGTPAAIHSLPGLRTAFEGVAGLELLTSETTAVTQWGESDWQFLTRLAAMHGLYVETSLAGETRLVAAQTREPIEIQRRDVVVDSSRWDMGLAGTEVRVSRWDWLDGRDDASATTTGEAPVDALEQSAMQASADVLGGARHEVTRSGGPAGLANQDLANALGKSARSQLLRWSFGCLNGCVRPGDTLAPTRIPGVEGRFLVLSSIVEYAPGRPNGHDVINTLECTTSAAAPPNALTDQPAPRPSLHYGRVVDVEHPDGMAGVRVALPWLTDEAGDGMWCQTPQPFGGGDAGAFSLPSKNDWVAVVLEPNSLQPPLVLGSIYRTDAPASAISAAPATRRVLAKTAAGHRIVLDDDAHTIEVTSGDGDDAIVSLVLDQQNGAIRVQAKDSIVVEAESIRLAAPDGVTIEGDTEIEGSLSVSDDVTIQGNLSVG